jgi:hypothetical protein
LLTGPALTFVGHWYYVGGAVGLLLGGLLTGILLRFVRELYDRNPGNAADTILYSFLFGIGFIEAAATPWFWMWTLPFVVLPVLGVIFISGQGAGKGTARNLAARRNNLPREGEHRLSRDSR